MLDFGSSQTFSHINTPTYLKPSHSSHLPANEDGTKCSETSGYKLQTPENYPKESIQHSEHGESLKSRILNIFVYFFNFYILNYSVTMLFTTHIQAT
jgi:hypothetical protein